MRLISKIFGEKSPSQTGNKPWKLFEKKAQEAEQSGALEKAAEYYEQALQKLKDRFEPNRSDDKYYRYKTSAISFSLNRVRFRGN
jgi:hypothetical protein